MAGDALDEFCAEARAFLDAHAEPVDRSIGRWGEGSDAVGAYQMRDGEEDRAQIERAREWRRTKYDGGFGWISGPRRYGGRELSLQHERAFLELESLYDVAPQTVFGSGVGIVAPTVLAHGPEWMKD